MDKVKLQRASALLASGSTVAETATVIGCSARTLFRLKASGSLPQHGGPLFAESGDKPRGGRGDVVTDTSDTSNDEITSPPRTIVDKLKAELNQRLDAHNTSPHAIAALVGALKAARDLDDQAGDYMTAHEVSEDQRQRLIAARLRLAALYNLEIGPPNG